VQVRASGSESTESIDLLDNKLISLATTQSTYLLGSLSNYLYMDLDIKELPDMET
jgi:hypothetical protein